jgi:quercetin dioxygenase-like cupin family protein
MTTELTDQQPAASGLFNARPTREQVFALEQSMREMPQVEMPVTNHFSHGVYGREIFIPAGSVLTGHIHKHTNMNVLLEGDMSVLTERGMERVGAGFVVVSPPGTKRAAYAHTDCRWLTVHGTPETDVDAIEREFIVHTEQEYLAFCETQQLLTGE